MSVRTSDQDDSSNKQVNLEEGFVDHPYHSSLDDGLGKTSASGVGIEACCSERSAPSWSFTDFGQTKKLSRDGSIHATDEVINAASHMTAAMLSILGTVLLISEASSQGAPWRIVSFSIYGASLIFLFSASALHHGINGSPELEQTLRMMDYFAIYPLIAGTFTPICLIPYHNDVVGWSFIAVVWSLAIVGMISTVQLFEKLPKWLTMTMYITLGWLGALMTYWQLPIIGWSGFSLFLIGGIFYTVGGFIFSTEKPNPIPGHFGFHEIWHLFVIAGAASHWCLMYFFYLPWNMN